MIRLNVNIDHIATIRQARRTWEPSVIAAAMLADLAGASGITVHLRGDRRHIQDEDVRILRSAINIGHDLGMRVIAEGVETEAAVKLLRELGCDVGQGYHFGRPAPADVFAASPLAKLRRFGR